MKNSKAWHAVVHGVTKCWTQHRTEEHYLNVKHFEFYNCFVVMEKGTLIKRYTQKYFEIKVLIYATCCQMV